MTSGRATCPTMTLVFDCGDTLLQMDPAKELLCLEALGTLGTIFSEDDVALAYRCVDSSIQQKASALSTASAKDDFLTKYNFALAEALGIASLSEAFNQAQRRAFGRSGAWAVAPRAKTTLGQLAKGHTLYVLANWDNSLQDLLQRLGLNQLFAGILDSQTLGVEKPDVRIFQRFCERTSVDAASCIYVGNEYRADIVGARAAGLNPILLDLAHRYGEGVDCPRVDTWSQLPRAVANLERAQAPTP